MPGIGHPGNDLFVLVRISIKGVVVGGITDIVATNILAIPLTIVILTNLGAGHSAAERQAAVTAAFQPHGSLFTGMLIVGAFGSILGGYVAAWLARHDELLNGALSAWLCTAIGIYGIAALPHMQPLWLQAVDFIMSPAAGLSGGYLRRLQIRSSRIQAAKT